jgi:ribosomal protein S18 acetylase RimI-like enzyme
MSDSLLSKVEIAPATCVDHALESLDFYDRPWQPGQREAAAAYIDTSFELMQHDERTLYLARYAGRTLGILEVIYVAPPHYTKQMKGLLFSGGQAANIENFGVDPSFRCRDIGTKLLDAGESDVLENGLMTATVAPEHDNHRAIRLYARRGYKSVGSFKQSLYLHQTVMHKQLVKAGA